MQISDRASDLLLAAEAHSTLGYSVIPLLGDAAPDRPKAPAIPWSAYQSRRATQPDFERWFIQQGFQGIAILTGRISSLVVLDFDESNLFNEFSALYPDLVTHHVIQTRRGYHIYFHLPAHLRVQTRKGQGIDLLSDGCYVVARPTTIAGFAYKAIKGGMPKPLTQHDLNCITHFISHYTAVAAPVLPSEKEGPITAIAPIDPQALYRSQVGRGRNQALFNTARTARDHGWSQTAVLAALSDLHAYTGSPDHPYETPDQRQREALATIRSAFSHPARPLHPLPAASPQLPTRVRERLYALKLTCVVRTIEGLREKGVQPGHTFSRQQAITLLQGWVGRDSVDHALHALAPDGQPLFARKKAPPLEPPPASNDAAEGLRLPETKKCFFVGATKSGKMIRGRKPHAYIMPANSQLCHKLGVRFSISDPMQPDDLAAAKKTRQASHREFIRRRPGQYSRRWLAERLGVSVRTTQRYDLELHIHVRPMFHQQIITWGTLNAIPDEPVNGMFLQDDQNHRYPARHAVAVYLLPRVRALYLMRQQANFYSLDEPRVVFDQIWKHRQEQQAQIEQAVRVEQGRAENLPVAPVRPAAQPRSGLPPPAVIPAPAQAQPVPPQAKHKPPKPAPKLSKRRARQPLPDAQQEALAQRVYNLINARTPDRQHRISQASARRAVFSYGTKAVESALKRLNSRQNILKPVGFFMTLLRSENKRLP